MSPAQTLMYLAGLLAGEGSSFKFCEHNGRIVVTWRPEGSSYMSIPGAGDDIESAIADLRKNLERHGHAP